ncbi:MAG: hypothetical protein JKY95_03710 [Planctomycetaceae bacterium]|nr:hypothetical protein [Planctomycetaceae bacterium]MBL4883630.1 hypothetical protein [Planctomycetaceae bacterium]
MSGVNFVVALGENVIIELNWTLLGIWSAFAIGKQTLKREGKPIKKLSPVQTIRVFEQTVFIVSILATSHFSLHVALSTGLIADESHRTTSKQSRNYPCKERHRRCGQPRIIEATFLQKQKAALF